MWDTIVSGGVLMVPLAACSVLAVWVIVDRAFHLRTASVMEPEIVGMIDSLEEPGDIPLARS